MESQGNWSTSVIAVILLLPCDLVGRLLLYNSLLHHFYIFPVPISTSNVTKHSPIVNVHNKFLHDTDQNA